MALATRSPFQALFTPLTLRHKTLKNRIVFGAHTANMAVDGLPGARHLGYYLERAKGGTAMIVVEPIPIHRTAVLTRGNMRHSDDAIIAPLKVITDACHGEGVVMIQQLYSAGQHGDFDNSFEPSWSPSGLPSYHDSCFNGILCQNRTMNFYRWKSKFFNNIHVVNLHCIINRFSFQPFGSKR